MLITSSCLPSRLGLATYTLAGLKVNLREVMVSTGCCFQRNTHKTRGTRVFVSGAWEDRLWRAGGTYDLAHVRNLGQLLGGCGFGEIGRRGVCKREKRTREVDGMVVLVRGGKRELLLAVCEGESRQAARMFWGEAANRSFCQGKRVDLAPGSTASVTWREPRRHPHSKA